MTRHIIALTLLLALALGSAAQASPWQFPNEVSVAEAYNTLYGTSYDTDDDSGLTALLADVGIAMTPTFNTDTFPLLRVLTFDTGATTPLSIRYGAGFANTLEIFNPGSWTSPTRGWLPNGSSYVDLAAAIGANTDFQLYLNNTQLNASNSILIDAPGSTRFVGFNAGGWGQDHDFNEPLVQLTATPIPGAALLLGSGLLGLVGLRRRLFT